MRKRPSHCCHIRIHSFRLMNCVATSAARRQSNGRASARNRQIASMSKAVTVQTPLTPSDLLSWGRGMTEPPRYPRVPRDRETG